MLFEAEDARAVAGDLHALGFAARVERERLAGEDDEEDHPWAVLTDAPSGVVEGLAAEHDGWWDEDGPAAADPTARPPAPARPLPTAPRRATRAGGGDGRGDGGGH